MEYVILSNINYVLFAMQKVAFVRTIMLINNEEKFY